jgi:hypothetical protein
MFATSRLSICKNKKLMVTTSNIRGLPPNTTHNMSATSKLNIYDI